MRLHISPVEQTQTPAPAPAFLVCRMGWPHPVSPHVAMPNALDWARVYELAWKNARDIVAADRFRLLTQASVN